jgi:hypothetical protein
MLKAALCRRGSEDGVSLAKYFERCESGDVGTAVLECEVWADCWYEREGQLLYRLTTVTDRMCPQMRRNSYIIRTFS